MKSRIGCILGLGVLLACSPPRAAALGWGLKSYL
jgi:hypothetical protein